MRDAERIVVLEHQVAQLQAMLQEWASARIVFLLFIVLGALAAAAYTRGGAHRQILDTLCTMNYPECVLGVDR